jgi:hypothetical protein
MEIPATVKLPKKLTDLLALEDSTSKKDKLFLYACKVPPHCWLWKVAKEEIDRLWKLGY